MITYNIRLDINSNGSQAMVYCRQGDAVGRRFAVRLYDGSTPIPLPDDSTYILSGGKSDGTQIFTDCAVSGNTVYSDLNANITSCVGNVELQLKVYGVDGSLLYSPRFSLFVEETAQPDSLIESTNDFTGLKNAMTAAALYEKCWKNPIINVTNGDAPAGTVTLDTVNHTVTFDITVQAGRPAEIGDEAGILVETGEDGLLVAGRKIVTGTDDPEEVTGLRVGDLYIKLDE